MISYKRMANLLVLGISLSASIPVFAADKVVSPEQIPGATRVDSEMLIELVASVPDILIIDSRIRSDRIQGYIEGSVSLPDEETSCETLASIIQRKDYPTIYYCNGPKCGRSAKAVKIAIDCGYSNINWFRGGFEEWKNNNYPYVH